MARNRGKRGTVLGARAMERGYLPVGRETYVGVCGSGYDFLGDAGSDLLQCMLRDARRKIAKR